MEKTILPIKTTAIPMFMILLSCFFVFFFIVLFYYFNRYFESWFLILNFVLVELAYANASIFWHFLFLSVLISTTSPVFRIVESFDTFPFIFAEIALFAISVCT